MIIVKAMGLKRNERKISLNLFTSQRAQDLQSLKLSQQLQSHALIMLRNKILTAAVCNTNYFTFPLFVYGHAIKFT
ncbi:CLUMA_CG019736, isoform A [Clunio marinus]|uniref:CLUMA_CG019736, isoform A n=1 Tax=Clunio marinus TaxID=568069 RepID=A0A1J1J1Y7_9DIPT|nr:CLUMA_CG019736, isoform A [Clunio marinus]